MSYKAQSPIERAEAELQRLQGTTQADPATDSAPTPGATDTSKQDDLAGSTADPAEPADNTQAEDPNGESFKQKWQTLQGMYRHSQQQVDQLQEQVDELTSRVAQPQSAQDDAGLTLPEQATKQDLQNHLQSLSEEYGEEFTSVLSHAIREEASKIVKENLAPIQAQVSETAKDSETVRRERFEENLASLVPDWREIYSSAGFENYLGSQVEQYSGKPLSALFVEANNAWDLDRIVKFFNAYKKATGKAEPQGNQTQTDPREGLLAPGQTSSSASTQAQEPGANAKIWTWAEAKQFYKDVQTGQYRGREAEAQRIDLEISLADKEGRLR